MCIETAIAKYTPIDLMLAEGAAVIAAPSVPAISKRVRGVAVKWVFLTAVHTTVSGSLNGGEVLVKGGVVAWAGMV